MKVWYLPLEAYRERYTEQLGTWTRSALARRGVAFESIVGRTLGDGVIRTGPVLDAQGRSYFALTQMAELVRRLPEVKPEDWLWFDDLFTPGYEALPYVCDQRGVWPRVLTRNWAQSVDPDDFTFAMRKWMRPYEELVARTATITVVASTCHKEMIEAAGLPGRVEVVGLPFGMAEAWQRLLVEALPWASRPWVVVYTSRLDREKQPHFLMDVVEQFRGRTGQEAEFIVCTGSDYPRSNMPSALTRLAKLERAGVLRVKCGLTKSTYYEVLSGARVQLNTARQDFVSFTAVEASAFNTPTLAPAFRSFPEALDNRRSQLYVPWSVEDCCEQLARLLANGEPRCGELATYSDGTIDRTIDLLDEE